MSKPFEQMTRSELLAELRALAEVRLRLLKHDLEVHQEELRAQHEQLLRARDELQASRDEYAELYDLAPVAYLTIDRSGVIRALNLTACALLGAERLRLIGVPLYLLTEEFSRDALLEHMRQCRRGADRAVTEVRLRSRQGREFPAELISRSAGEDQFRTVITDLTDRKAAEEEIRQLNASLEDRVRQRTAELEAVNAKLRDEIAQREEAEAALREANRRKDEFLAMLGHELRNPLAPIRNTAEILRFAGAGNDELLEIHDILLRQTNHMTRIVDDLLDVARIARGKIELRRETVDWTHIVRAVVRDSRGELEAGGVSVSLDLPDKPVWVDGDATRLAQVLSNLLHNAGKFTSEGGQVRVHMECNPAAGECLLRVEDTGIGMDPEMVARVWDTFSQADCSLDRSRGGLGLGLALVRGLVELHGGQVEAHSPGKGQGSAFTVRLPLVTAPEAAEAQARQPAEVDQHLRVLVIDDQHDTVCTMQRLLRSLGHDVHIAENGDEGLRLARELRPHVIFSDIGLPGMDGYSIARQVRQDPAAGSAMLIAITGYGTCEDKEQALAAGFDRHLTKPVPVSAIESVLASWGESGNLD